MSETDYNQDEESGNDIDVKFKVNVSSLNAFDVEKRVNCVITVKRIYIYQNDKLKRAHWISKVRGIVVSTKTSEMLIALPFKDLRLRGLSEEKANEIYAFLQETYAGLKERKTLKHCYRVPDEALKDYYVN